MSRNGVSSRAAGPTSTPSSDYYGGQRPGANLFAESLVCLDAATGKMKWYYQVLLIGGICGGLLALFWYQYLNPMNDDIQGRIKILNDLPHGAIRIRERKNRSSALSQDSRAR